MSKTSVTNLLCLTIFTMLLFGSPSSHAKPGKKLDIASKRIEHFAPDDPNRKIFGKLEFLGGLELSSKNDDFGGISGFRFTEANSRLLAVTDKGRWISGILERDGFAPTSVSGSRMGSLRKSNGKKLKGKRNSDAESLEIFGKNFLISFERNHRVDRFSWQNEKLQQVSGIQTIKLNGFGWENNNGPEAIAYAEDTGDLFIFPENDLVRDNLYRGLIIRNDKVHELFVIKNGAYSLTDASLMDDGSLVMLERHYNPITGVSIRIRKFAKTELIPNAQIEGETLLEAGWDNEIDNMEGLSISDMEDGSTRLTIISDDNFSNRQRTLLLEFKLLD